MDPSDMNIIDLSADGAEDTAAAGEGSPVETASVPEQAAVPAENNTAAEAVTAVETVSPEATENPDAAGVPAAADVPVAEAPATAVPETVAGQPDTDSTDGGTAAGPAETPGTEEKQQLPEADTAADGTKPANASHKNISALIGVLCLILALGIGAVSVYMIMTADRVREAATVTPWYQVYTAPEQELPAVDSFDPSYTKGVDAPYRVSGNSHELYACDAAACEDKGYYYFGDPTEGGALYRVSKGEEQEKILLCDLVCDNLNLNGGRLYFLAYRAGDMESAGIYSVATDGSDLEFLLRGQFYSLRMSGNWLYYIAGNDGCIRKMNIQERHEYPLTEEDCNALQVDGDTIYYISHDGSLSQNVSTRICSMDVEGKDRKELSEYGNYSGLSLGDGMLYYSVHNEGYGWIDLNPPKEEEAEEDDKEKDKKEKEKNKKKEEAPENFVQIKGFSSTPIFRDGEIWFVDRKDMRSLAVYTPETKELRHYGVENVTSFWLMNDVLIIRWLKDGTEPKISVNRLDTGEMVELF
ncbi:MAG: DUF5050 domain-containing protein [Lachnospiraceae bacterium]|nr:DUF5050 domain-containing protein [Lachnospiraceae bacterium]